MEDNIQKLIKEYEAYAEKHGFKLNPDRKIVENIVKMLLKKEEELGERYCPCRRLTGDVNKDKEIICPCIFHLDEIEKEGHCHCLLFVKQKL
ncbi:MAG: ferredoxin-thioredoxin reductase catalytic domain-containing protein [Candidatus Pacebacteria bacterium]|nr:ferredoxin-thioredoxin reductase catalytic domain-containing protein [Candidatus Paceibacterota bacterium]